MIPKTLGQPATPNRSGLTVEILKRAGSSVSLRLKNAYAGHKLPTGDPERFIRVDIDLMGGGGGKVLETRSIRIGQQWEWWPKARRIADTRLKPQEERVEVVKFTAAFAPGATVRVTVTNVRMAAEAAKFHNLIGKYPLEAQVQKFDWPIPAEQSTIK